MLPIGLSFHTFQSMGYTFDVYRRKVEPERHWGTFATFIVFFPQLVAGPIERAGELLPQLHHFKDFDYDRSTNGLKLMAWGLFKKVVVADRLATLVDPVYANPGVIAAPTLVLATVAFGYQIYCDFSGYTDIAIGSAEVLGIRLRPNFRAPYHSASLQEFWTRWHMSLSTWFRDYVYIPLGGNRVSPARWSLNILIVFMLSGVWHGANWTFFAWGLYHGVLLIGERSRGQSLEHRLLRRGPQSETSRERVAGLDVVRTFCSRHGRLGAVPGREHPCGGDDFLRIVSDWESFLTPERLLAEMARCKWQPIDIFVTLLGILSWSWATRSNRMSRCGTGCRAGRSLMRWAGYYSLAAVRAALRPFHRGRRSFTSSFRAIDT